MIEYDKDMTLEECIDSYGTTRGIAAYLSVQSIEHLSESTNNYETLETFIFQVLSEFIDEKKM